LINIGDVLFSYETDKAAFDEEAQISGTLLEIFANEDDDVPVLTNVCVIGEVGENVSSFSPFEENSQPLKVDEKPRETAIIKENNSITSTSKENTSIAITSGEEILSSNEQVKISPRARILADKTNVDYRFAKGSGPHGRIIERDITELKENGKLITSAARLSIQVEDGQGKINKSINIVGTGIGGSISTKDLEKTSSEQPTFEEVRLSNMRKVIAKAMQYSLSSMAQLTLNTTFDATKIINFRNKLKEDKERYVIERITLNDIISYAVSRTLLKHKELNANLLDDKMLIFKNVHLGIAIDTERGLMVPTVTNSDTKTLAEISSEIKQLSIDCQAGTIKPDLLKGGTFTITNLGTLDIESFTPVINPPQTGILGVNNIIQRVREVDGAYKIYPAMGLSLTFDHRAIDGAPAARFLKDLKIYLESFSLQKASKED